MVVERAEHGRIAKVAAEREAVRAERREESNRKKAKNAQDKEKKSARGTALKSVDQFASQLMPLQVLRPAVLRPNSGTQVLLLACLH